MATPVEKLLNSVQNQGGVQGRRPKVMRSLDPAANIQKRLGRSGLKVSVPILGAMSYGTPGWASWVLEEKESLELLKAAYDRGLNTVGKKLPLTPYDADDRRLVGHCERLLQWGVGAHHR